MFTIVYNDPNAPIGNGFTFVCLTEYGYTLSKCNIEYYEMDMCWKQLVWLAGKGFYEDTKKMSIKEVVIK